MDKVIECKQYTTDLPMEVWREAVPLVANAARYSRWEFLLEDVFEAIMEGRQQLWTVYVNDNLKFIWVTEILQQSGRKICTVFAAAGEMEYGWEFWPWMSNWMRMNEIVEAEVYCRPSMSRLLQRYGLKVRYEILSICPLEGDKK